MLASCITAVLRGKKRRRTERVRVRVLCDTGQRSQSLTSLSMRRRLSSEKDAVWLAVPIFRGSTMAPESQLTEPPCRQTSLAVHGVFHSRSPKDVHVARPLTACVSTPVT